MTVSPEMLKADMAYDMTKREAFAMAAMQGILAGLPETADYDSRVTARQAVAHADDLLAELNKESP